MSRKKDPLESGIELDVESNIYRTKQEFLEGYWQLRGQRVDLLRKLRGYGFEEAKLDSLLLHELRRLLADMEMDSEG